MYKVGGGGRAQKKSEAVGRRLGAGPAWPFLRSSGVLSTPHLGFCRGSKGTREEPSGLSSRLRSDFLNSAGGRETTSSAIPSTPPTPPGPARITSCSSPAVLLLVRPKVTFLESKGEARLDCGEKEKKTTSCYDRGFTSLRGRLVAQSACSQQRRL